MNRLTRNDTIPQDFLICTIEWNTKLLSLFFPKQKMQIILLYLYSDYDEQL